MQQPLAKRIQAARLALHLTQHELAKSAGCSQSAVSNYENGNARVLSPENLDSICSILGITRHGEDEATDPFSEGAEGVLGYCPQPDCPAGFAILIAGRIIWRPRMCRLAGTNLMAHCVTCGSSLEFGCKKCLTPLVENSSFCVCGEPLVQWPEGQVIQDREQYARDSEARFDRHLQRRPQTIKVPRVRPKNSGNLKEQGVR